MPLLLQSSRGCSFVGELGLKIIWMCRASTDGFDPRRSCTECSGQVGMGSNKRGTDPASALQVSISDLNLMRVAAGSQWRSTSSGALWAHLRWRPGNSGPLAHPLQAHSTAVTLLRWTGQRIQHSAANLHFLLI